MSRIKEKGIIRMFKKSVVSGLMLSTSVLGIAGCSVPQKEAVSDKAEHVAKDPASEVTTKLASSVASRPEQPVSTTSQETVVPMTQAPTISAEALKQDVAEEPAVKPVETVANNAPVVETTTYQAKPTFVELSAPKVVAPTVEATVNTAVEKPVEAVNASAHNEVVEKQEDVKDEKATVEATPAVTENKQEVATEESVQPATEKPAEPVAKEEPKVETVEKPAEVVEQPAPQAQPQAQPVAETPAVEEKVQEPAPTIKPETRQHPQYNSDASGQCTWGVKTVAPWVGDYWGNGGQWAESAARDGFRTGKTAEVGSVASWDDGGYGHVAYVTDVDPATGYVKVLEANYNGDQSIGDHRGWFDASNPTWGNVTYIYQN